MGREAKGGWTPTLGKGASGLRAGRWRSPELWSSVTSPPHSCPPTLLPTRPPSLAHTAASGRRIAGASSEPEQLEELSEGKQPSGPDRQHTGSPSRLGPLLLPHPPTLTLHSVLRSRLPTRTSPRSPPTPPPAVGALSGAPSSCLTGLVRAPHLYSAGASLESLSPCLSPHGGHGGSEQGAATAGEHAGAHGHRCEPGSHPAHPPHL